MREERVRMKRRRCLQRAAGIFLAAAVMIAFSGCRMPSYNLSGDGSPSKALATFLDAVMRGDDVKAKDMVYNYYFSAEKPTDGDDLNSRIMGCLYDSRSYELVGKAKRLDSHTARVTVNYTTFDIGKFEEAVTEEAVEIVQQREYNGEVFENADDTQPIINRCKEEQLEHPEAFYTTQTFEIEMISCRGRWMVMMTGDFYKALSGYAI